MSVRFLSPRQILRRAVACVALGSVLWWAPVPAGLSEVADGQRAWHVFAVFLAVIVAFLLRPFPMGAVVLAGLVVLGVTGTLTIDQALAGYGDSTVWLVVAAFLIAGSVLRTGLGRRLALVLVRALGRSTLGLAYAQCGAEALLGSVIPSNTARGGGLLAPVARSLAEALDALPVRDPHHAGRYLMLVGAHANLIASSMYLTGMAANPLVSRAAADILDVEFGWTTWLQGSIVPCLAAFLLLPLLLWRLVRPTLTEVQAARQRAVQQLRDLGPLGWREWVLAATLVSLVVLWATGPLHGLHATLVAWIGVVVLLLTGAEPWEEATRNSGAWDALIWLGGLLTMANALKTYGFVGWFAGILEGWVSGMHGLVVVLVMGAVYFYSMYGFSMLTAHLSALIGSFFVVAQVTGAPPLLTVAVLAYFSTLCACLTNYSSGPIIIYFGQHYVSAPQWFGIGFVVSLFHLAVWFTVGLAWWKFLGWW